MCMHVWDCVCVIGPPVWWLSAWLGRGLWAGGWWPAGPGTTQHFLAPAPAPPPPKIPAAARRTCLRLAEPRPPPYRPTPPPGRACLPAHPPACRRTWAPLTSPSAMPRWRTSPRCTSATATRPSTRDSREGVPPLMCTAPGGTTLDGWPPILGAAVRGWCQAAGCRRSARQAAAAGG